MNDSASANTGALYRGEGGHRLNQHYPQRIVTRMKKTAFLLGFLLLGATSAFAQSQQFGFDFGGTHRLYSGHEANGLDVPAGGWSPSHVKEVWYATAIEQDTLLKFKVGELDVPLRDIATTTTNNVTRLVSPVRGRIEHADVIVDYRFSEPFGSTGLFLGAGWYRERGLPAQINGANVSAESDWGWNAGVNGDFPLNRRFGVMIEGTYHSIAGFTYKPRVITGTVGLRMSF